jgi:GNAT superfamily N-acetyltransferase
LDYEIIDLTEEQADEIDSRLEEYDEGYITYKLSGSVCIGIMREGRLIAGAMGCMTAFKVFYVSTVFVDENQRGKGFGKTLVNHLEQRAVSLGANMIRLDTFDWQGADFYKKLGYEQVGQYENKEDGFSEHFFLKRI